MKNFLLVLGVSIPLSIASYFFGKGVAFAYAYNYYEELLKDG